MCDFWKAQISMHVIYHHNNGKSQGKIIKLQKQAGEIAHNAKL